MLRTDLPHTYEGLSHAVGLEIAMGLITPLYDDLWNEYLVWSALVGLFTFGWLYHHSFFYRSEDGENPNVDDLKVGVFPAHYDNMKLELNNVNTRVMDVTHREFQEKISKNFVGSP